MVGNDTANPLLTETASDSAEGKVVSTRGAVMSRQGNADSNPTEHTPGSLQTGTGMEPILP